MFSTKKQMHMTMHKKGHKHETHPSQETGRAMSWETSRNSIYDTAKVQASIRIRAVMPEPTLFADVCSRSRENFSQSTRHVALLIGRACTLKIDSTEMPKSLNPVSILHKSIAGRYRPVRVADGPITARCRFIKNASWGFLSTRLRI